jgi:gamma-glutamyltranspeptidase/glutathione hydrolase
MAVIGESKAGAVAAGHPAEAEAGYWALSKGGSAADVVVAAAFVAFVVEPWNCGLGGYGHASVRLPSGEFISVDHGPRAPGAAWPEMFAPETPDTAPGYLWPAAPGGRNEAGGLAVAVPGAVPGLAALHRAAGRLPWAQLLEPAIAAAGEGLTVEGPLAAMLERRAAVLAQTGADQLFPPAASHLEMPALEATLRRIAAEGPAALYAGDGAAAIVRRVQQAGGLITVEDLARFTATTTVEKPSRYKYLTYATGEDPVGRQVFGMLQQADLAGPGSADHHHWLSEACAHALIDNVAWYGDPDYEDAPVVGLGSAGFAENRAKTIHAATVSRPIQPADPWPWEGRVRGSRRPEGRSGGAPGTSQVSAVDGEGLAVALITTVGGLFGSGVAVPEMGFVLNNGMVNFDTRPTAPNCVRPGKRPFFAVPALTGFRDDGTVLAVSGSGYYRILSAVVSAVVNLVEHGLAPEAAVRLPRSHGQGEETFVDARVAPEVVEELRRRGHAVVLQESSEVEAAFARVCLAVREPDGVLVAAADPAHLCS